MGVITYGIDVSHWNDKNTIEKQIQSQNTNIPFMFCIVKASEGKTLKDSEMENHLRWAIQQNMEIGMYHFARPANNKPVQEAENFLKQYAKFMDENPVIALDWEGDAMRQLNGNWALEWLEYVREKTGVRALFYTGMQFFARGEIIAENNYGLWYAKYGDPIKSFGKWKHPAMWQYTSAGIDKNKFYGSIEQFKKYGIPNTPVEELAHCPTCGKPL